VRGNLETEWKLKTVSRPSKPLRSIAVVVVLLVGRLSWCRLPPTSVVVVLLIGRLSRCSGLLVSLMQAPKTTILATCLCPLLGSGLLTSLLRALLTIRVLSFRIAEGAPADAQDHRAVVLDQCCEGQFGRLAAPGRESFQQLTVRQLPNRTQVEQGSELPPDGPLRSDRHRFTPVPPACTRPLQ
jgi:hypothetical protein